jgi:hypothetical protein
METQVLNILRSMIGLGVGSGIGVAFGLIQNLALRRNEQRQQAGALKSGWGVMPGSMRRVAYLMVVLVAVQILCPLLFADGTQWWVSGGVCLGYGGILLGRLRRQGSQG